MYSDAMYSEEPSLQHFAASAFAWKLKEQYSDSTVSLIFMQMQISFKILLANKTNILRNTYIYICIK